MKQKINLTDFDGKKTQIQREIPAKDHLAAQMKYKMQIFRDKTKYSRKVKHKKPYDIGQ